MPENNDNLTKVFIFIFGAVLVYALILKPIWEWIKAHPFIFSLLLLIIIAITVFLLRIFSEASREERIEKKKKEIEEKERRIQEIMVINRIKWDKENRTEDERKILAEKLFREESLNLKKFGSFYNKKQRVRIPPDTKRKVRERSGYRCQICGTSIKTQIHHIDKDPSNNRPGNLIELCPNHHAEADSNAISKERLISARDKQAKPGRTNYV